MLRAVLLIAAAMCLTAGCREPAGAVIAETAVGAEAIARITATNGDGDTERMDTWLMVGSRTEILGPRGLVGLSVSRIEILSMRCELLATIALDGVDLSNGGLITIGRAGTVRWAVGGRPEPGDGPLLTDVCRAQPVTP